MAQTAEADGAFSLQGRLTTGLSNDAVADGQYNLTIKVYDQGTGNVIGTENDVVMVSDGIFSTMVGNNSSLNLQTDADYEIGISVDGGAELAPRIMLGSAPHALTADVAADAEMVGGMMVSSGGEANTVLATDAQGRIDADLLRNSINVTGSGVSVNTDGGMLNLNIAGGNGGTFQLPFSGSANVGTSESVLRLTAMGQGSAATLINSGTGAALQVRNTSSDANARIITALNAGGNAAFEVMGNGRTVIKSTVGNALDVSTDAVGEAALKVTGGLTLDGPAGTGTIPAGTTSVTIDNPLVNANSIIILTANSAINLTNGLRLSGQGNGSFTVSLLDTTLGTLNSGLKFNYLIVNTVTQ